ncbi:MAG: diguanylate cyclase domain-containing protein, partial [Jatrophihabitantaceae bacterium]
MNRPRHASHAARLTFLLTVGLGAAGAALAVLIDAPATMPSHVPSWLLAGGLYVSFLLGELLLMNIEFRRQAHSLTLAGIPLVLGALLAPLQVVVLARLLGAATALAGQRMRWQKFAYNVAAYAFEAALDTSLIHALLGTRTHQLGLPAALAVLAVVIGVDQLMSGLVLGVIQLHNGRLSRREIAEVLIPSGVLASVTTAAGIGVILLVAIGPVGVVVVLVAAVTALLVYHSYVNTTRRHQALELIHDFVSGTAGAASFAEAAQQLLPRVRTLLRAGAVHMTLLPGTDAVSAALHLVDTEDGFAVDEPVPGAPDWATVRALAQGEPLLAPRSSKDPAVAGWLRERGYRDAMMVSLPATSGLVGTVTVIDRLGETATFTDDDLTLLQTLTGHLAVRTASARMVERLGYDAHHDALTGLANRAHLVRQIVQAEDTGTAAVMLLDLDRFKEVNDALGHAAGDELLRVVAQRLRDTLPADATIARLGGDEFAAHVPDLVGGVTAAQDLG